MNFDFKSTFNSLTKFSSLSLTKCKASRRAIGIILFNATSTLAFLWLYLSNEFLPATVGSLPHGSEFIHLIKIAIALKFLSSIYASGLLIQPYAQGSMQVLTDLLNKTSTRFTFLTAHFYKLRTIIPAIKNQHTNLQ